MVDTAEVANQLGTDTKMLRRFLRSKASPVKPVGSGARYRITRDDMPAIEESFKAWAKNRPITTVPRPRRDPTPIVAQSRDEKVWAEEEEKRGPIVMADIRDPKVRAAVRRKAKEQEDRLMARLLAKGLHISQLRD